jgi:hypothetical protein
MDSPTKPKTLPFNTPRTTNEFQASHIRSLVRSKAFIKGALGDKNPLFLFLHSESDECKEIMASSKVNCLRGYDILRVNANAASELKKKRKTIVSLVVPLADFANAFPDYSFVSDLLRASLMQSDVWFIANFCSPNNCVEAGGLARVAVADDLEIEALQK